jgi:hypothetical protein
VFSDIHHDRYQCLNRTDTRHLLCLLSDIPSTNSAQFPQDPISDSGRTKYIVDALIQSGLLASAESSGKPCAPVSVARPTTNLEPKQIVAKSPPGNWVSFLRATLSASAQLRLWPLKRILSRVEKRKPGNDESSQQDRDTVRNLAAVFHGLRPYYVREYICRFDSLALIEFLALYRQFPDWIFGVTGNPFTAHCWVQDGNCVLNDTVDFVRRFTPIMAF